ncbi:unnamed protein product [Effrenium voratum]|uniref:Uncharacterized protein n=2 Tax=Effrenium voratum TaxID=2562239 RepID=A0AA36HMJ3_9DINO|nr:unnamed protein product [Effrenium voratum]
MHGHDEPDPGKRQPQVEPSQEPSASAGEGIRIDYDSGWADRLFDFMDSRNSAEYNVTARAGQQLQWQVNGGPGELQSTPSPEQFPLLIEKKAATADDCERQLKDLKDHPKARTKPQYEKYIGAARSLLLCEKAYLPTTEGSLPFEEVVKELSAKGVANLGALLSKLMPEINEMDGTCAQRLLEKIIEEVGSEKTSPKIERMYDKQKKGCYKKVCARTLADAKNQLRKICSSNQGDQDESKTLRLTSETLEAYCSLLELYRPEDPQAEDPQATEAKITLNWWLGEILAETPGDRSDSLPNKLTRKRDNPKMFVKKKDDKDAAYFFKAAIEEYEAAIEKHKQAASGNLGDVAETADADVRFWAGEDQYSRMTACYHSYAVALIKRLKAAETEPAKEARTTDWTSGWTSVKVACERAKLGWEKMPPHGAVVTQVYKEEQMIKAYATMALACMQLFILNPNSTNEENAIRCCKGLLTELEKQPQHQKMFFQVCGDLAYLHGRKQHWEEAWQFCSKAQEAAKEFEKDALLPAAERAHLSRHYLNCGVVLVSLSREVKELEEAKSYFEMGVDDSLTCRYHLAKVLLELPEPALPIIQEHFKAYLTGRLKELQGEKIDDARCLEERANESREEASAGEGIRIDYDSGWADRLFDFMASRNSAEYNVTARAGQQLQWQVNGGPGELQSTPSPEQFPLLIEKKDWQGKLLCDRANEYASFVASKDEFAEDAKQEAIELRDKIHTVLRGCCEEKGADKAEEKANDAPDCPVSE